MATKQRRMMLTLPADVIDLVMELANEMSVPAATLISRLITDSKPRFKATLDAIKLAKGGGSLLALNNLNDLADSVVKDVLMVKKENTDLKKKARKSEKPPEG